MILTLIEGLAQVGWASTLVYHPSPAVAPLAEEARELGAELRPVQPFPDGLEGARRVPQLARMLKRESPTVFHATLTWPLACKFGLASAVFARIPAVVATVHSFPEFYLDRSKSLQQRLLGHGVGRYLAVSQHVASQLRETIPWPARKIQVVRNCVPLDSFERAPDLALRKSLGESEDMPLVLAACRLEHEKGVDYLVEAAVSIPEARFVVAGDGGQRASLEARARALGVADRIVFLGHRRDVPDLLATCDVLVLPSFHEGLPLIVLEAMASGRPVVATAVGGSAEAVVDGETGLLVPPSDAGALAAAIRRLLAEPPLARALGEAGRKRARSEFSASRMVEQVARVYDELLSAR